jgi:sulfur transfer complex TusBCD TusB component (DsrH family)
LDTEELSIPNDWDDVTPEWMTAALFAHFPNAEVSEVALLMRDDGTNRRARFGISYSSGTGPAAVFAKAPDPAHTELNAATGGVLNEPRLFQSGVVLPLDHPAVYTTVIDEPGLNYIIVMEDVTARGADPLNATRTMTVEQAINGVRALARLHSRYWGKGIAVEPALHWVQPYVAWTRMGSKIPIAIQIMGDTCPEEVGAMSVKEIIEETWAPFIGSLTTSPQTFLHGDPHIGNTYVLPDNDVGFLDWQVVRRGNWSVDVGYFLQGALTTEDRRQNERDILEEYSGALDLSSDERPSSDDAFLRYRASASHGLALWLSTLSTPGWQARDISLSLAQRYSAAFVDLETRSAVRAVCS